MNTRFSTTRQLVLVALALLIPLTACADEHIKMKDRVHGRISLQKVEIDPAIIDVSDGDTVNIRWSEDDKERIRILGIDTPEVAHHHWGQHQDQPYGTEATSFAEGVFAAATKVELLRAAETDGYGRTLGYLFVNGKNYSVLCIKAGYSAETVTFYGDNGLPEQAEAILAASREVGPVHFEAPHEFRKRMRQIQDWEKSQKEE